MIKRPIKGSDTRARRWWPTPSIVIASTALFVALGGTAVAAAGLIQANDIATGAVTSRAIKDGSVEPKALSRSTQNLLKGASSITGATGDAGSAGAVGPTGTSGINGAKGESGPAGTVGAPGANGVKGETGGAGAEGSNGASGAAGPSGASGATGPTGAAGANGSSGASGATGPTGATGANGSSGATGPTGATGANGSSGATGPTGAPGANGSAGATGPAGAAGATGPAGANGTNGTITPLSAKQGLTPLPTGAPATTVVELAVPAGRYVVFAKTEMSQTGAGDTVECLLKSGVTTLDQSAMKTLPALAATAAPLQAVITTASPTLLTVQCSVAVANGAANYSSLIAIPTA